MKVRLFVSRGTAFVLENPEMLDAYKKSADEDAVDFTINDLLQLSETAKELADKLTKEKK